MNDGSIGERPSLLLLRIGLSWIVGVFLGSVLDVGIPWTLLACFLFVVATSFLRFRGIHCLFPLCLAIASLGVIRYDASTVALGRLDLSSCNGQLETLFQGTIADCPTIKDGYADLTVTDMAVLDGADYRPYAGEALVRVKRWSDYQVGDRLVMVGRLEDPPELDGFSYREYLLRRGIVSLVNFPEVIGVVPGHVDWWSSLLSGIRDGVHDELKMSLPEPQASLAEGVLLGGRTSLTSSTLESFNRTSTTHILAVSGFNVALVASMLAWITRRLLRRGPATFLAIGGVVAYTCLVGASPSAVRAGIMGCIVVFGAWRGRQSHVITSLILAASLMVLQNPFILWDIGFQLSVLATGGLSVIGPAVERLLMRLPFFLRESVAFTVAAQVSTLPVIMVNFQQVSLVALPTNLLIVPALPFATILSGITAVAGIVTPGLGPVIGWPTWLLLTYVTSVVEYMAEVPWASISVGSAAEPLAWTWYIGLGMLALHLRRGSIFDRFKKVPLFVKWAPVPAMAIVTTVVITSWFGALSTSTADVEVSFLNVGQGDAILITTAHRNVLIDGGPKSSVLNDALGRRLPFWRRDIDLLVVTHGDQDHVGGLAEIANRYNVREVLKTDFVETGSAYGTWLALIRNNHVAEKMAGAGQVVHIERGVDLYVLYPPTGTSVQDLNSNEGSLVLRLVCNGTSFLFLGDAPSKTQDALVRSGLELRSTVLMVPHHGADGALLPAFLEAVAPQIAVISVGSDNNYGHPSGTTVSLLAGQKVYRTDVDGTIKMSIRGQVCTVSRSFR